MSISHSKVQAAAAAIFAGLFAIMPTGADAAEPSKGARKEAADAILEKYFARIGGREKFASAKGEYIAIEIIDKTQSPVPFYFELCFSYEDPRGATRANSYRATRLSAYDIDKGWTLSKPADLPATFKEWDADRLKIALDDWRGNFEVLTHRLAARDPDVYAVTGVGPWEGWLEIYEKNEPVFHLLINENGEPIQFRRILDDNAVRFGPLVDWGGYSFPSSGHFEGSYNTFDFHVFRLIPERLTKAFTPPADRNSVHLDCR